MVEKRDFSENTAVIKSASHMVRVMLNGAETVFAASDILKACGIKYPLRWLDRNRKAHPEELEAEKLGYPMMTEFGYRQIKMVFVSADVSRRMVGKTPCSPETKKWLLDEVLTYRIDTPASEPASEDSTAKIEEVPSENRRPVYDDALNRRIDNILIELLEIKKAITRSAAG